MTFLPDVNVWIALAVSGHPQHTSANDWFENAGSDRLVFCRITEMGLLRLLTNAHVMDGAALTAEEAWNVRDQFHSDSRVRFVPEGSGFEDQWRQTSGAGKIGANFWTDAYLSSFCALGGYTLLTFDKALAKQKLCKVHLLK